MKRVLVAVMLLLSTSLGVWAEITISAGGKLDFDSTASYVPDPVVDAALLGDLSLVPTDRIGFYGEYSAAGSYGFVSGASTGLFGASAEASYMAGDFLSRLSMSGLVDLSSTEPFYGAASSELLLSYGGPQRSFFAAPRLSFIEEDGERLMLSARVGSAFLVSETFLMQPELEAGLDVPGGISSGWYINPSFKVDRYSGGPLTVGVVGGYKRSLSTTLEPLVTGGPLLPIDTYDLFYLNGSLTWFMGKGNTVTARLPLSYAAKGYNASNGTVDLGVPAWVVSIEPALDVKIPITKPLDLVLSASGSFALSNNSAERLVAVSTGAHVELHP